MYIHGLYLTHPYPWLFIKHLFQQLHFNSNRHKHILSSAHITLSSVFHLPLRSSETVKLIDLLDAAKDRMRESLKARADEGKCPLQVKNIHLHLYSVQYIKYDVKRITSL